MSLQTVLARFCPLRGGNGDLEFEYNLKLITRSGDVIPCHRELLQARCTEFPQICDDGTVDIDADALVVFTLLRWIYSEVVDKESRPYGPAAVRLALSWGLRDCKVLQDRFLSSWRSERRAGTLVKDLVRAYDSCSWGSDFSFVAGKDTADTIAGGWAMLLRARSSYFDAMLGGKWKESSTGPVEIQWPGQQLDKLVRFLHGHRFIDTAADLPIAIECDSFFGVPALVAEANDWIVANLKVQNAAALWEFVDGEPRMCLNTAESQLAAADASDACLDFFIGNFAEMASNPPDGDGSWVPLHDLNCNLMHRLLATGLVSMPTNELMQVVERYAEAKCGAKNSRECSALLKSFRPPVVMFNRELRDLLTGSVEASIRTLL